MHTKKQYWNKNYKGIGLSIRAQKEYLSKIDLYALGNTYCTICMNLKHKTDINAMGQCFLMDKERDILGSLDIGQAVVKLQGRVARPFQIVVPEFVIEKGKISDTHIKKHMQDIAPTMPEEDFRLPADIDESNITSKETNSTENLEIAFLQDIQDYPESGVAERYKRLGIFVRQGQKIKSRALKDELIEEHTEIIRTGRIIIIRLTKEGWSLLSKEK